MFKHYFNPFKSWFRNKKNICQGCLKHDRSVCHECKEDELCDGQPADNCDFMKLHVFHYNFNVRSKKVNKQFTTIKNVLEAKKQALIEIYRKDPRISHDDAVSLLQTTIEDFDPLNPVGDHNAQLDNLQKQLAQQQKIVAEAGEMKIRLTKTEREKSNLAKELKQIKEVYSNLKVENEKLVKDFKAVTLSRSEADGERKRLEGDLQQTQTRLYNAERANTEQSEKIKKLEQELNVVNPKRGELNAKEQPSKGAAQTVETASFVEREQTLVCESFSDDNFNVTVSSGKLRVKRDAPGYGYCFLKHPKIRKNKILKWCLQVPKHYCDIGMVIILE